MLPDERFRAWNRVASAELADASFEAFHGPMREGSPIALAEIITALSLALDLTEDAMPGHAVRCCLMGMRIGQAIGLSEPELCDLYYALLLKDIGCSSNAGRMYQVLGGDERKAKKATKTMDRSRLTWEGIQLAWRNTLPGAPLPRKAQRFWKIFRNRRQTTPEWIQLRCERGANIVLKMGFNQGCSDAIYGLDELWNGSGEPRGQKGDEIPILSQILNVAQHLDCFFTEHGRRCAIRTLKERAGTWFDPRLVDVVLQLDASGDLWDAIGSDGEQALLITMEPGIVRYVNSQQIDSICEGFADVVDAKSTYTYEHSLGVAKAALKIAKHLGLDKEECQLIYRASLLHDLGKLSVPNNILDKPAGLNESEWKIMRGHPQYSQAILEKIPTFAPIARIVGRHHEKLDGSGYPLGIQADELTLADRIVTMADIYGAMSEDRPYRKALPAAQIIALLQAQVPGRLDPLCFQALLEILK